MVSTLIFREATAADMPAIRARHAEIEAEAGAPLDLPEVDARSILGYWVVEKDGQIIGGVYLEKSIRQCHFGKSPEATAAIRENLPEILDLARRAGARFVHCDVFRDMEDAETIGKHLEKSGYQRRDELIDYTADLRG